MLSLCSKTSVLFYAILQFARIASFYILALKLAFYPFLSIRNIENVTSWFWKTKKTLAFNFILIDFNLKLN